MMWLVRLALRRPISVAVMALLMLVLGTLSFFLMNIDIFPAINVPVVMVVWNYPGMASLDMERRMVFIIEFPQFCGSGPLRWFPWRWISWWWISWWRRRRGTGAE
jgi:Cu/Ag efflux pump CusA